MTLMRPPSPPLSVEDAALSRPATAPDWFWETRAWLEAPEPERPEAAPNGPAALVQRSD